MRSMNIEQHPSVTHHSDPLSALCAALIKSAIDDILRYERRKIFFYRNMTESTKSRKREDKRYAAYAWAWVRGAQATVLFEDAAEHAGLRASVIREMLENRLEDLAYAYDVETSFLKVREGERRKHDA